MRVSLWSAGVRSKGIWRMLTIVGASVFTCPPVLELAFKVTGPIVVPADMRIGQARARVSARTSARTSAKCGAAASVLSPRQNDPAIDVDFLIAFRAFSVRTVRSLHNKGPT